MFPFLVFYVACRFLNFPADKDKSVNMSALKFYSSSLKRYFVHRRWIGDSSSASVYIYFFMTKLPLSGEVSRLKQKAFFSRFLIASFPVTCHSMFTFDLTKIAFESLHQNLMAWKRTGRDGFVRKKQNSHFDHFPLFHPGLKTTWSRKFPLRDLSLSFYLTKLPLFESQKTYEGVSVNKSMVWLIAL